MPNAQDAFDILARLCYSQQLKESVRASQCLLSYFNLENITCII